MNSTLVLSLIEKNISLVKDTAIKNCHALGLNSFIINKSPKMRLFTVDEDCELYLDFNKNNPIIPIHPHKYDDHFFQVLGTLRHHIYTKSNEDYSSCNVPHTFNEYHYYRLSDNKTDIKLTGTEELILSDVLDNPDMLKSTILHTVSIPYSGKCAWVIIEGKEDPEFNQVAYHQNLQKRDDLYKKFDDPENYLINYFKTK